MCWLAALNPQLSRDPDPPVLSSGAERLPQLGGGGGQGRRGLGAGHWARAGGTAVGSQTEAENRKGRRGTWGPGGWRDRDVRQVRQVGCLAGEQAWRRQDPASDRAFGEPVRAECVAGSRDPYVLWGAGVCSASGFSFRASAGGQPGHQRGVDGMQSPCHHAELWRQLPLGSSDPCLSLVADRPGPGRGSFAPWVEPQLATYLRPWDRTPPRPALGTW